MQNAINAIAANLSKAGFGVKIERNAVVAVLNRKVSRSEVREAIAMDGITRLGDAANGNIRVYPVI